MHMLNFKIYIFFCFHAFLNACSVEFMSGKYLHGWTFKTRKKSNLYTCAADCVAYPICKSFNLDTRRRICHLNTGNHTRYPTDLQSDESFWYSDISDWKDITLGPCKKSGCGITQRCVVTRKKTVHCEEQLIDVSRDKPAKSSSVFSNEPSVAVDGNSDPYWSSGSCFAVQNGDLQPWWQVDLLDFYAIVEVHITSRKDCCTERLRDFALEVFKKDPVSQPDAELQLCYMYNGAVTQPGVTVNITCTTPVTGRYLRVKGDQPNYNDDMMQFCEVQVLTIL